MVRRSAMRLGRVLGLGAALGSAGHASGSSLADRHPAVARDDMLAYAFFNEYTSDNVDNGDCNVDEPWSTLTISRMNVGCHHLKDRFSNQDMYTFLSHAENSTKGAPPAIESLLFLCDGSCGACQLDFAKPQWGECVTQEYVGGSFVILPPDQYCVGSPNHEGGMNGLSVFFYSEPQCSMVKEEDQHNTLNVRNVGVPDGSCRADGVKGPDQLYYSLNMNKTAQGTYTFDGKLRCTDDRCSEGCVEIKNLAEGECHVAPDMEGHGIQIWQSKNGLKTCGAVPNPPSPPPSPSPPSPPASKYSCDGGKCVEDNVGGKFPSEAECTKVCSTPADQKYTCLQGIWQCTEDPNGVHPSEESCTAECKEQKYACVQDKCVVDSSGKLPSLQACDQVCKPAGALYRCEKDKCVEDKTGVSKELCESACESFNRRPPQLSRRP